MRLEGKLVKLNLFRMRGKVDELSEVYIGSTVVFYFYCEWLRAERLPFVDRGVEARIRRRWSHEEIY